MNEYEAAHAVLYVAEGGAGYKEPGGFITKLVEAAFHADMENLYLLERVYPELVDAVVSYKNEVGGRDRLIALTKERP